MELPDLVASTSQLRESSSSLSARSVSVKSEKKTPPKPALGRRLGFHNQFGDAGKPIFAHLGMPHLPNGVLLDFDEAVPRSAVVRKFCQHFERVLAQEEAEKNTRKRHLSKTQPLLQSHRQLGLAANADFIAFFRSMCEDPSSAKNSRLSRTKFKSYLAARFGPLVGERVLSFLETQFNTLYQIDFQGYQQVVTDFLNAGPEGAQKLVFWAFSLANPGVICEHDLFTLLEEFKGQGAHEFYKKLLATPDVPRDYHRITDTSDLPYFEIFLDDIQRVSAILSLHKKMSGLPDFEPDLENIKEIKEHTFETKAQFEASVFRQIEYVLKKLAKQTAGGTQVAAVRAIIAAEGLLEMRDALCRIAARHQAGERSARKGKLLRARSIFQTRTSTLAALQSKKEQPSIFKAPCDTTQCLGDGAKSTNCVFVTFEDFCSLVSF